VLKLNLKGSCGACLVIPPWTVRGLTFSWQRKWWPLVDDVFTVADNLRVASRQRGSRVLHLDDVSFSGQFEVFSPLGERRWARVR
jgi:hypothetical protein